MSTTNHDLARRHYLPKIKKHSCLQRYKLYPYWPQRVQALQPEDKEHHLEYCRWVMELGSEDDNFIKHIINQGLNFTEECVIKTPYTTCHMEICTGQQRKNIKNGCLSVYTQGLLEIPSLVNISNLIACLLLHSVMCLLMVHCQFYSCSHQTPLVKHTEHHNITVMFII
jgi:hypothetical protein